MESILANAGDAFGNRHARQAVAVRESRPANAGDAVRNRHARQVAAAKENKFVNAGDAVWDRHACQAAAVKESILTNAGDAVRDRHARQAAAAKENKLANAGDAIRDPHARQAATASESQTANAGDAGRNDIGSCHASRVLDELCSRFIQQSAIDRTKAAVVGSNVDIRQIREMIIASGRSIELEVDGGVNADTAKLVVDAGADVLVAGSAVFGAKDLAGAIRSIRVV